MTRILLVEDDKALASVTAEWLRTENYSVDVADDGPAGRAFLSQVDYDVAILDWDLPGISGIELCLQHRAGGGTTPILVLTGKREIADKERGLDSGADDYLTKPFSMRELSARLRALLRRGKVASDHLLICGDLVLDAQSHTLKKSGEEVHLAPKDFEVLEYLLKHKNEVVSQARIFSRVWGVDSEASLEVVKSSILRIRKITSTIESVRGVGYRLNGE